MERFGEIVVGTQIEPTFFIGYCVLTGEKNYRRSAPFLSIYLAYLKTTQPGQAYVQNERIIAVAFQATESGRPASGQVDFVVFSREKVYDQVGQFLLIFGKQYSGHGIGTFETFIHRLGSYFSLLRDEPARGRMEAMVDRGAYLKLSIAQKGLIIAAVPLVWGLVYLSVLGVLLERAEATARRESRARAIVSEASQAQRDLFDAGSAIVAWNYMRTSALERRLDASIAAITHRVEKIKELMKGDSSRADKLRTVEDRARQIVSVLQWHKAQIKNSSNSLYSFEFTRFRKQIEDAFKTYVDELHILTTEERAIEEHTLQREEARRQELQLYILAGVALNLVLSLGVAVYFSRDIAFRLNLLKKNAERVVKRQSLLPTISGSDEVADVDAAFRRMASDLNRAEAAKRDFVAMVSHDLRSPLSAIQGALELVNADVYGEISAKGKSRVRDAEYECVRLLSLINELLDIEKIEAGMMEMNKETADLAELVVRGSESVKLLAEAKNVRIEVFGAHALAPVDSERLVQVFVNLFSNAVKYSPQGGTISVNIEEKDGRATIKIQDQGPGIPKQLQESVFDRFKQAHGGGSGTSGLGLAICKAIVEAHDGKIGVVSEVGNGSLFWLQLPTR